MEKINDRINRKFYIFGIGISLMIFFSVPFLLNLYGRQFFQPPSVLDYFLDYFFVFIIAFVLAIFMVKRLHDFNASGWWILIFLPMYIVLELPLAIIQENRFHEIEVPFTSLIYSSSCIIYILFILWLCFKKGDADKNKYGEPLAKDSNFFTTLLSKDFLFTSLLLSPSLLLVLVFFNIFP